MQRVTALLRAAGSKFEERSLRERLLLLVTAIAVMAFIWHVFFFQSQLDRVRRLGDKKIAAEQKVASLKQERAKLLSRMRSDRGKKLCKKANELRDTIHKLDKQLRLESKELISPRRMAEELRRVLSRSQGLELERMANQSPRKIELADLADIPQQTDSASLPELYRHPLNITFTGSYPEAMRFFDRMKRMSPRLFWDRLEFTVLEHPEARLRVTVHTLSLDKAWIGF